MDKEVRFVPDQASTFARNVDWLYYALWGMTTFFTVLICVLIIYFGVRYRRSARVDRTIRAKHRQMVFVEVAWSVIPLAIILVFFALGAVQFFGFFQYPADGLDITVIGKQWMWSIQHPSGRRERNTLHVPVNTPVRLTMISEDVIHDFFIPAFRNKMDVLPGRYTRMWFTPTQLGEYHLFCAEYCGTSHSDMVGTVVVMKPEDYAAWSVADVTETPERTGERLFAEHRCTDCHQVEPTFDDEREQAIRAPALAGLYGRTERMADGRTVVVDDNYIRDSIRNPRSHVVAGYEPIMPVFTEQELSEQEIRYIIEYLQSLGASTTSAATSDTHNARDTPTQGDEPRDD